MEDTSDFQVYLLQTASKELKKLANDSQTQINDPIGYGLGNIGLFTKFLIMNEL